ncbi:MAG TPA: hypothetical protein VJ951_00695 [Bacteroidales bacterium]|nr:hypothetical protein [Bacteroidales bacterium]
MEAFKKLDFNSIWKGFSILLFIFFVFQIVAIGQQREWNNQLKDDGTIHSLGNGKMLVYGQGPEIHTIYPGPFTTPALFNLFADDNLPLASVSTREQGTAIWTHQLSQNGTGAGFFQDFVDAEIPVFVRHQDITGKMEFHLKLNDEVAVVNISEDNASGINKMLLMANPGTGIYQKYVYPKPLYHQIAWKGAVSVESSSNDDIDYTFKIEAGESFIYFIGGPDYPAVVQNTKETQETDYKQLTSRTRKWWNEFSSRRYNFDKKLAANVPLRSELLQTIDDVSVMIKTQQADEGAVIAGYPYPLGYVRDQYGVSRALLTLGLYQEAKSVLNFYWNVWQRAGVIHCAQGIGVDNIFHVHENDEVESPGYLLLQAFDYLRTTGDEDFIHTILPMLEWCHEVQKKHIAGGMLPFNGDETYVAGGILPRSALNDGSAEATMLFIDAGTFFLDWLEDEKIWSRKKINRNRKIVAQTKDLFRDNFWIDGNLITNQPKRLNFTDIPNFRNGICERGGPDCLIYKGLDGIGGIDWTQKDKNDRYQCASCFQLGPLQEIDPKVYTLISTSLLPLYFDSELVNADEIAPIVSKVYNAYSESGILTSQIVGDEQPDNNRSVGYDYGLILDALMQTQHDGAEEIYRKTLSITDDVGSWSEYFVDDEHNNTRCRPWESAINLEALINFAREY